jgi:FAD dependent oxidoreductase
MADHPPVADDHTPTDFDHLSNASPNQKGPKSSYDVVVYGGTVAGINAAYTAALQGSSVALLEPTAHLGGMTGPGGLTNIDQLTVFGNLIGGNWYQQLQKMAILAGVAGDALSTPVVPVSAWPWLQTPSATSSDPGYVTTNMRRPNPRSAMLIMSQYAALSSKVDVFLNASLQTTSGSVYPNVECIGLKIVGLNTTQGIFRGKVFIDASYEGDVLAGAAAAGIASYTIGRESSAQYNEALAGRSLGTATAISGVSFTSGGVARPSLQFDPGGTSGQADGHVQPMNFRVPYCPTSSGGIAFTKPSVYNSENYHLYGDIATQGSYTTLSQCIANDTINGGSTSMVLSNDSGGGLPFIMHNNGDEYPDATPTRRAQIFASVKAWYQGLLYAIANETFFPAAVNSNAQTFGYDPKEFAGNGYWPYQMYIREGRRMIGKQVMTQTDVLLSATQTHPICFGTYNLDIHVPIAYASSDGTKYTLDGAQSVSSSTYGGMQIPMEALVPQAGQCTNLIVPVCISCTHIAWGAIRLEPTFAMMGDAAGLMAYRVASGNDATVQTITYSALATLLTSINAKVS